MNKIENLFNRINRAFRKLKMQLFSGYLVAFAVIALLMIGIIFTGVKSLITEQIGQSRMDVLKQISERSNTIKNSTITISNLYRYNTRIYNCLQAKSEELKLGEETSYLDNLKENYDKVFHEVGLAYDVIILGENGFQYASHQGERYDFNSLKNQLWYRSSNDEEGDITFISSFKENFGKSQVEGERYVFSAFRKVNSLKGEELGVILINIDEQYLEQLYYTQADSKSNIYIFDKMGNIVSSREKSLLGMNFIGVENFRKLYGENQFHIISKLNRDYLLSNYYDSQTGWTIVEEMPCAVLFAPLYRAMKVLGVALFLCLLLALSISYYMAGHISRPILELCRSMNQVKKGDFDVISEIKGYEEISQLKDSFNEMAREIKKLMESVKQKEINKRRTEMDFLRAQINPHFLYNTLFSIQCLIEIQKNEQAVQMMAAFIDLLKLTLSVDTDLITIEEELESAKKYLVLQQIRYGDKIHFECEMEPKTQRCLVPPLIIQPIIENAIFHGLEPKEEAGMIVVESELEGKFLYLTVSDDGIGMSKTEKEHLEEQFEKRQYQKAKSIGIVNVSNRIYINFGENYGVSIASEPGYGTTVTLKLPVILKQGKEKNEDINC